MSTDLYSELSSIKSDVVAIRSDVASLKMSSAERDLSESDCYMAGVDVCVSDQSYIPPSGLRKNGINKLFAMYGDCDTRSWVIENPTWLREDGTEYSICSSMCSVFSDTSVGMYKVICGEFSNDESKPGTFYMAKGDNCVTVAFVPEGSENGLSVLGSFDTAVKLGTIESEHAEPTMYIEGAITPGGGGVAVKEKLPWSLSYDKDTDEIVAYRPEWDSRFVDEGTYIVSNGWNNIRLCEDLRVNAESGNVYAVLDTHVGNSQSLGLTICSTLLDASTCIRSPSYALIGKVTVTEEDGASKTVSIGQWAEGIIREDVVLHTNSVVYKSSDGKYYDITQCSCMYGDAADDGLYAAGTANIVYTPACGHSGVSFDQSASTSSDALVLAYTPEVRVTPFIWANLS